jgi:hypothetical protein
LNEKDKLQFSVGSLAKTESLLEPTAIPKKQKVRIDWVGHPVLRSVNDLKKYIGKGDTFAVEVLFGQASRFISIGKQMTCRDLRNKIQNSNPNLKLATGAALFAQEKPKIRMDMEPDDLLFDSLKRFLPKLNRKHQRVCISLQIEDETQVRPVVVLEMKRSLSQILNGAPESDSTPAVSP